MRIHTPQDTCAEPLCDYGTKRQREIERYRRYALCLRKASETGVRQNTMIRTFVSILHVDSVDLDLSLIHI